MTDNSLQNDASEPTDFSISNTKTARHLKIGMASIAGLALGFAVAAHAYKESPESAPSYGDQDNKAPLHYFLRGPAIAVWFNEYGHSSPAEGNTIAQAKAAALEACKSGSPRRSYGGDMVTNFDCKVGAVIDPSKSQCITYGAYQDHDSASATRKFGTKYRRLKLFNNFSFVTDKPPIGIGSAAERMCENWHKPSQRLCESNVRVVCNFN